MKGFLVFLIWSGRVMMTALFAQVLLRVPEDPWFWLWLWCIAVPWSVLCLAALALVARRVHVTGRTGR